MTAESGAVTAARGSENLTESRTAALVASARALAAEGFRVFPCHTALEDGCSCGSECASPGKHPRTPNGCKDATSDAATIEAWWRRWPDANVGVATGGGLVVIDLDGFDAQSVLEALAAQHDELPETRAVRTGRDGGRHLWFRHREEGGKLRNSSGRLGKGIDTRGDGGYVLAPPSLHASGRRYSWERPDASLAVLPSWILARLTAAAGPSASGGAPAATRPQAADPQRLTALGEAVLSRELEALAAHSREPGTGRGTALFAAAGRLGRIVAAGGLDLSRTWQALIAAGQGLGLADAETDRNINRGLEQGMAQPLELADRPIARKLASTTKTTDTPGDTGPEENGAQATDAAKEDVEEMWPQLAEVRLPPFPLDALPVGIARFVQAVATETQTPPDLAGVGVLGVLSSAALGAAVVDCGNWVEELGLYIIAVAPSGDHKSAVLRSVVAPLQKLEREWREEASASVRDRRTSQETLQARKQKLVRKAAELEAHEERIEAEAELADVAARLDEIGEPVTPRLLADDATPEALGGLLAKHGRIAILTAEAAFFDNLIGRYDAKGSGNLHLVCKAYNGEYTHVDRRNRDPEQLDRPLLTVMLAVQPHVLRGLIENQLARDQGLVGRFIYVLPETLLGRRRIDAPAVPAELSGAWEALVRRVSTANPLTEPTEQSSVGSVSTSQLQILRLSLSPSAKNLLDALRSEQEPRLIEGGDLRPVADWIARHAGRVARIAGLLHLAELSAAEPIGEGTMRSALRIGEYLLAHSLAALTEPDEATRRALAWLSHHEADSVSQRDLHRGPLGGRGTAEKAQELAQTLIASGALHKLPDDSTSRPGQPPSPRYAINPALRRR